ncbi:MAG: hypothetical protein RLZZ118_902 [Bacteroidota bacterium]|jgi:SET domain-containing protein
MSKIPHLPEPILAAEADYLYIQASQIVNAGNGLFTAIPIFKNEIISIFKGEILTQKEAQSRIDNLQDGYFINMLNGKIMDSQLIDCFAKYANDADGNCNNTFQSLFKNNAIITLSDKQEICIVATKKIKAGDEIFCSYGKGYWNR